MDLLLRRAGTQWTAQGDPFPWHQFVECCGPLTDFGYTGGWPVLSLGLIEFAADNGFNVLHMRPGPYMAEQEVGESPLKTRADGKVWLGQINEKWWERQEYLIWLAGTKGIRVEIGMTDLWRARHGLEGTVPHPWMPDYNVHGIDRLHGLGSKGVFNDFATLWFGFVVEHFGRFGNVIWFDGTEAEVMPGWDERSTLALRDLVRELEAEHGYPVHMFGSNGNDEAKKRVDFALDHGWFPRKSVGGRPTNWQEYNGTPPLTADQWMLHECERRQAGTHMALWRGWRPMSVATVEEILARRDTDDCSFLNARPLPPDDSPGWGQPFSGQYTTRQKVETAAMRIWNPCNKNPIMSLKMLAFELQQDGAYAGWNGDHVMVWNGNAFEEIHWVSFGNGCRVNTPYKGTYPFHGALPPEPDPGEPPDPPDPPGPPDPQCPTFTDRGGTLRALRDICDCYFGEEWVPCEVSCTAPPMDMEHGQTRIKLDCEGYWCDATPSVHGCEYCAAIDMPCMPGSDPCVPRCDCPPRPEGHPERQACETVFFGGDPLWRTDGTLELNPDNRSQARSDGTWIEVCRADGTKCTRGEP